VLAIAATHRIHAAGADESERARWLARFDTVLAWFAARAADAPGTFGHVVPWLEAERAVAVGDFRAAMVGFDSAIRAAAQRDRRWQQGLIAERAAAFCFENGLRLSGDTLLRDARLHYEQWGATAKVLELERRYPELTSSMIGTSPESLREARTTRHTSAISVEEIDLLGVLNASQALSSETNLDRLRVRVKSVLKAMTGATAVQVALWNEDAGSWLLSIDDELVSLKEAAARRMIPLSVFRYVERTAAPLVAADATRDSRFAKDPYFADLKRCSLLAVPILSRGAIRALVVMENQLSRNAFVGDRLDSVMLIAGQLAVSVDNALLYASLERKVAERTEALAVANQRLEALSVTDALTGLANRRRLADVLNLEWQRALRPGTPLALAMIDIDYFKAYNDCYGHPAGDQCLRRVAAVLNEAVRVTDLVARYGGEEFAVVMPGVNLVTAKRISDRAREAVVALRQPHEDSPLGIVTVSVGVAATVPSSAGVPDQLIDLADHRLYQAKNHGRNRVIVS
jgi:diguanylate cyclase (GGDEF)-like protein